MISRSRVAILISGRGSNMLALIRAAADPDYPAAIVGVLSDRVDADGLALAAAHRVPARAISRNDYPSRTAHEEALDAALRDLDAEVACLAGYMRFLSPTFVERWQGKLINIHPSLLPAFKGLDTHRRVLEAGVPLHGCTVHYVTAALDDGPIIAQATVPVFQGDTEEALAARVLEAEHRLYPAALRLAIT